MLLEKGEFLASGDLKHDAGARESVVVRGPSPHGKLSECVHFDAIVRIVEGQLRGTILRHTNPKGPLLERHAVRRRRGECPEEVPLNRDGEGNERSLDGDVLEPFDRMGLCRQLWRDKETSCGARDSSTVTWHLLPRNAETAPSATVRKGSRV